MKMKIGCKDVVSVLKDISCFTGLMSILSGEVTARSKPFTKTEAVSYAIREKAGMLALL